MPPVAAAVAAFAASSIGSAVITGAVVGAVVGGITAAVTGGDILKGIIVGGVIGGVTGGIAKGFSGGTASAAGSGSVSPSASGGGAQAASSGASSGFIDSMAANAPKDFLTQGIEQTGKNAFAAARATFDSTMPSGLVQSVAGGSVAPGGIAAPVKNIGTTTIENMTGGDSAIEQAMRRGVEGVKDAVTSGGKVNIAEKASSFWSSPEMIKGYWDAGGSIVKSFGKSDAEILADTREDEYNTVIQNVNNMAASNITGRPSYRVNMVKNPLTR